MTEITFKVTPKGEGKTKWLLEVAKKFADEHRAIYLFTENDTEYIKFCEKYFNTFKVICPVQKLSPFKVTAKDIVLIDDLLKHSDFSVGDISFIHRNCYKMFVTIEGTTTPEENKQTWDDFYEQLTLDIQEVIRA